MSEFRIGEFIRKEVKELFDKDLLSKEEIKNLQDYNYSKKTFDLKYPFFMLERYPQERYWKDLFGNKYYLCNYWFMPMKPLFEKWLAKVKK